MGTRKTPFCSFRKVQLRQLVSFKNREVCRLYVAYRPSSRMQTGDHERKERKWNDGWRRGRSENREGFTLFWLAFVRGFVQDPSSKHFSISLAKMYHVLDEGKFLGLIFVEKNNISLERSTKIAGSRDTSASSMENFNLEHVFFLFSNTY